MLVQKPSSFQKVLSRIYPVRLIKKKTSSGKDLVLQLYRGQYQLAYGRVFYSDGFEYFPVKKSLTHLGLDKIVDGVSFLSLGSGLGSLSMVLHHLVGEKLLTIDYVDINSDIIELCEDITKNDYPVYRHQYFHADANQWMRNNSRQYDFVFIDLFEEHVVPIFVFKKPFMHQIHASLHDKGYVIMNMMFHSEFQQHEFEIKFSQFFPVYDVISTRKNKIYIAQK